MKRLGRCRAYCLCSQSSWNRNPQLLRCTHDGTETTPDGMVLCWVHARRETRIKNLGYSETEKIVGIDKKRFCDKFEAQ